MDELVEALEEHGYAVVPGFLDRRRTAAVRALLDRALPPADPIHGPFVRDLRHPIDDPLMAELVTDDLLALGQAILRADSVDDLQLLEQVLIRTDPKPPPHGPLGWHVDWAFFPTEVEATPRQTYYHLVHACSTVEAGGGAFTIVPGSHRLAYAATAALATPEELAAFQREAAARSGVDLNQALEVCCDEGDLIVFNPMALHSASGNARSAPRYVYFASLFDRSAVRLAETLRRQGYLKGFSAALENGLPPHRRGLLDWARPERTP